MATMIVLAAVVASHAPSPSAAVARVEQWRPWIVEASLRFDVPQAWIAAVITAESGGRTHLNGRPITSRAGAMGLMQVMPQTYRALARTHALGPDPGLVSFQRRLGLGVDHRADIRLEPGGIADAQLTHVAGQ